MDDMIIIIIDYFSLVCLFFYLIPLNTLLWSLFKAIVLNDIKSIIALSTISQISYMFIALLINLILCFYHIISYYWNIIGSYFNNYRINLFYIIGFPRRIYDYSMIFFKFQWFNSLGLIGIYLSIIILLFTFYPLFWLFKVIGVLLQFPCCRLIFI